MTSVTRIGILGGTFDPVHIGHVDTALAAHRALALDRVLVMPSGTPPHRASPPSASRFHRFAMTALAVTGLPGLMVSDLEIGHDWTRATRSTRWRDCRRRAWGQRRSSSSPAPTRSPRSRPGAAIRRSSRWRTSSWCRGPAIRRRPSREDCRRWRRGWCNAAAPASTPDDGPAQAGDVADNRLKVVLVDAPTPDVSSTEVRRRLEAGESITGLVPTDVETYIGQHGLYSRGDAGARFGKSLA